MKRTLAALRDRAFDLTVVGGGIHGICVAREAAHRGLAVCLLEQGDFCSATSFNSLKIIHGGLRYLQQMDLRRMRQSIHARSEMLRLAPHLVRPLPFVIPTFGHGLRGSEALGSALLLNELISWDRNRRLAGKSRIPRGRLLSRRECLERLPGLPDTHLVGGALWYDGQLRNSERMALELLRDADANGAEAANHVEVTGLIASGDQVQGVRARDRLLGEELEVRSRSVVNTTGPWTDGVLGRFGATRGERLFQPSKAFNLLTRRIFDGHAAAIPHRDAFRDVQAVLDKGVRHFFVVPWGAFSLIGTRHLPWSGKPEDFSVEEREIESFLEEVNAAYPPARLARQDVLRVYAGMAPSWSDDPDDPQAVHQLKSSRIVDHASQDRIGGLISVVGVKWTTACDVAERVVDRVARRLGRGRGPVARGSTLPCSEYGDLDELVQVALTRRPAAISEESMCHLVQLYGSGYTALEALVQEEPSLGHPLSSNHPTIGAQVVYAARCEMAMHLEDVVERRTELGLRLTAAEDATEVLRAAAGILAGELGWSPSETEAELARVGVASGTDRSGATVEKARG